MPVRRVVSGFAPDGSPVVLFDGPAPAELSLPPEVGADLVDLWRTDSLPADTISVEDATVAEFALMPSGCLFRVIDLAPGDHRPLWHATASIDFNYVVRGSVTVLLGDEGDPTEVHLSAGDTYVHRGPRHAWVNRGDEVCRLVCSSVAATLPPGVEAG
jgi:hypothetical protein